ncbi:prohead protease/major capsid protein fusion protein [Selenomonas ruminantium]|uniref:prohead protease/major capsid protein fusion protein n=1 Tax=Selenomonas ruminantium TaxID=971 RepID=UPI0026EFCB8F|nr:prohead protease/major capsid protein fusion protein [Selenomonas ruminantium]
MTMKPKSRNEPQSRDLFGTLSLREAEEGGEDSRTVELSLSSEEPYARWFGTEILSHNEDAIDLTRLQELGVMLYNHDRDAVIGKILSVELDQSERKLRAVVQFDEDEESEKIYQKVKSGTLKGVSVGYIVNVWEDVAEGAMSTDGRFAGPCSVATRWTPYELSIVSIPADTTVGVGRSMENTELQNGDVKMKDNQITPTATEETQTPPVNENEAREAGMMAERQRVQEISALCRQFGIDGKEFIEKGMSVEAARAAVLDQLANERTAQTVTVAVDEMDKFRAAATDGLAMRAGLHIEKPVAGAGDFRGKRMLRLAAECIEREKNTNTRNMTDEELVREALTGTGAFPGILSNVANKSMAQAYQTAPTTYQLWTGKGSNTDFKAATRYRLSEADELEKVNENGEFKHGELKENSVSATVATYGKTFSLTRQAIINDDMGALKTLPSIYGAACRRMINKMVYAILTDNPTIEDAALFHASHGNLQTQALTVAGLGKIKAAMAKQKNIGGKEFLNIQPAYLIVPVDLEVEAAQLINSVVDPSKNNAAINPFANKLSVVADPELSASNVFYMVAAPGIVPTIEVTSLNGNETPTMESAVQFDTLGIKWRIYHDVGVNLLDFRGIQKSTIS